ncbi:MAG: DnaJ domain-containing protein [Chloroflexi bacterium]|nr:DnaJ domain-containing protein [Chloroflexota bacterium]
MLYRDRQDLDYYRVLGVAPNADLKTIKAAYRRLALKYHPDTQTDEASDDRMKQINEAYTVLSDPARRAAYDRKRKGVVLTVELSRLLGWVLRRIVR